MGGRGGAGVREVGAAEEGGGVTLLDARQVEFYKGSIKALLWLYYGSITALLRLY